MNEWINRRICCTGRWPCNDCCTTVLYRLRPRHDERPPPVSDSKLHPRQLPCVKQIHAVLDHQDTVVLLEGIFCKESHRTVESEGGHCQLCALQVAAVVLAVLRGIQVRRAEFAEERRYHCCQLDRSVCRWWPGTSATGAVVPRDHCRLQQQVSAHICLNLISPTCHQWCPHISFTTKRVKKFFPLY